MASVSRLCLFTLLILAIVTSSAPATAAEEFKVCGADGWRPLAPNETEMFNRWAANGRFHVGDSLRFEYNNDTVEVVDKWGYYHCNSTNPISVFNDGNTVINLDRPGPFYFVSAEPDHCKNGQRLMVEVMAPHGITPALSPSTSAGGSLSFVPEMALFYFLVIVAIS